MQVVRNKKWSPTIVHASNTTQGSPELIKALSPIKREMCIYKIRCTNKWSNKDMAI